MEYLHWIIGGLLKIFIKTKVIVMNAYEFLKMSSKPKNIASIYLNILGYHNIYWKLSLKKSD